MKYLRRRFAVLMLMVCMPLHALATLDRALCAEDGVGNSGMVLHLGADEAPSHEQLQFGGASVDSCGLCHLGFAPLMRVQQPDVRIVRLHRFNPSIAISPVEFHPPSLERPPRATLA